MFYSAALWLATIGLIFGTTGTSSLAQVRSQPGAPVVDSRQLELLTIRELTKSIRENPNDPLLYLRRAFVLSELGHFTQALDDYNRAINLAPNSSQGYFNRGNLRIKMGIANLALQDYARAISLNPNLPEVYVARGFVRAELGDESGAIADFDRARLLNFRDTGPRPSPIP
jgi:tetratricopeptide (TPR) repeat protein